MLSRSGLTNVGLRRPPGTACALGQRYWIPHTRAHFPGLILPALRSASTRRIDELVGFHERRCQTGGKLCDNNSCWKCYANSFAIHARRDAFSKRNTLRPRDVTLHDVNMHWFVCDKCEQDFKRAPRNVAPDKAIVCEKCKAGERIHITEVWSSRNSRKMDEVEIGEPCWVTCNTCQHDFVSPKFSSVRAEGKPLQGYSWCCPYCTQCPKRKTCSDSKCKHCRKHCDNSIQSSPTFAALYSAFNVRPLSDGMLFLKDPRSRQPAKYWIARAGCLHLTEEGGYCRDPVLQSLVGWSPRRHGHCRRCRDALIDRKRKQAYDKRSPQYEYSRSQRIQEEWMQEIRQLRKQQVDAGMASVLGENICDGEDDGRKNKEVAATRNRRRRSDV